MDLTLKNVIHELIKNSKNQIKHRKKCIPEGEKRHENWDREKRLLLFSPYAILTRPAKKTKNALLIINSK